MIQLHLKKCLKMSILPMLLFRAVNRDFGVGGDESPPIGGGPKGGDKGPMGGD